MVKNLKFVSSTRNFVFTVVCLGLTSVGVDVTLHDMEFVYGIPEHADSLALKSTKYWTPFCYLQLKTAI